MTDYDIALKLTRLKLSAEQRQVPFDLSFKVLKQVLKRKTCYFTKLPLNNIENDPNQMSIDRLDNDKGYVDGNIVVCSRRINQHKKSLTLKEIESLYKGVKHLL